MKFTELDLNAYKKAQDDKIKSSVSMKDKWNLKMDVEEVKKDFIELQNTAEKLPDSFVKKICDTDAYPFDEPVDETTDITTWCNEVDDFLKDTENFAIPAGMREAIFEKIYSSVSLEERESKLQKSDF